jgi:hypothetical protein
MVAGQTGRHLSSWPWWLFLVPIVGVIALVVGRPGYAGPPGLSGARWEVLWIKIYGWCIASVTMVLSAVIAFGMRYHSLLAVIGGGTGRFILGWWPLIFLLAGAITIVIGWRRARRAAYWRPSRPPRRLRPVPTWIYVVIGGIVVVSGVIALNVLLGEANRAALDVRPQLRMDAIKTGLTIAAGAGGAAALLLAVRRQWLAERTQRHTEDDATEKRVTELFTAAVEQLGSDKAAVRLGGLYSLERLAQGNPTHRQTVVDVLCAYLRMPFEPPAGVDATHERSTRPGEGRAELEVRLTAQRIIAAHFRVPDRPSNAYIVTMRDMPAAHPDQPFWPGCRLDLAGATLVDIELEDVHYTSACFKGAHFYGSAKIGLFRNGLVEFPTYLDLSRATFHGLVELRNECGTIDLRDATFYNSVYFNHPVDSRHSFTLNGARMINLPAQRGSFGGVRSPRGWKLIPDPNDSTQGIFVISK